MVPKHSAHWRSTRNCCTLCVILGPTGIRMCLVHLGHAQAEIQSCARSPRARRNGVWHSGHSPANTRTGLHCALLLANMMLEQINTNAIDDKALPDLSIAMLRSPLAVGCHSGTAVSRVVQPLRTEDTGCSPISLLEVSAVVLNELCGTAREVPIQHDWQCCC